ncbi:MAG: type II toxin-antitoxin system RelE/ParE family toxin [Gemmataceae bacterium]|nr:type II toxin-antitoxin system RelE/ParE family toxin [Gemmataceae bacterium]
MNRPLILRPEARADVAEIYDYLAGFGEQTRAGFEARLRRTFERIETTPLLYAKVYRRARIARVGRSKYLVIYIVYAARLEVVAVTHGSRSPSVWKARL